MTLVEKHQLIQQNQLAIDAHGPFPEEVRKRINYRFRLDWNYFSNRIEGGTLSREETRSVMVGNIDVRGKPIRDVMEMNGHDQVVREVLKMGKGELRLSEKRIKEVHKAIVQPEEEEQRAQLGEWKTHSNEVIGYKGEKIAFAAPLDVPDLMHKLLDRTNAALDKIANQKPDAPHPVILAADFHIDYLTIHPFFDGNGRTARIFTNLILIVCGFPAIIIKDHHKQAYNQYLGDIQAYGGDKALFYAFIADRVIDSQQLVLDALAGKSLEEADDLQKDILLLKQELAAKEQVSIPKNWENLNQTVMEGIVPLLVAIEEKTQPLVELFNEVQISFTVSMNDRKSNFGASTSWRTNLPNLLASQKANDNDKSLTGFSYRLDFKSPKSNLERNYFSIAIHIQFDEYAIILNGPDQDKKKYPYHPAALLADKDKWVNEWVGNLVQQIRKASHLE